MEKVIKQLKEIRDKKKEQFVEESIIVSEAYPNSPVQDPQRTLKEILELNKAISILENHCQLARQQNFTRMGYEALASTTRTSDIG